ncbi:MAG: caspase family protein [Elusimicrobia bacterium]|nr:caspase family protein [Elusimicrobiota bacterium]
MATAIDHSTPISIANKYGHPDIAVYLEQVLARQKAGGAQDSLAQSEPAAPPVAPASFASPAPSIPAAEPQSEFSLSLGQPDFHEARHADDYAVVVGITKYQNLPPAEFAARDAEAVRNYLLALGYPERNIAFLTGDRATRTGLVKEVESWLPNNVDSKSTVFFYYSGHGAPDVESGAAYLVPWDGDPEYLSDTAYPLSRLYKELGRLPAKHVLVALDSCFSGAGGRSVLAAGVRPLVTEVDEGFVDDGGKIAALSASRANQVSGVLPQAGHGLFTYYLLKGLDGGAMNASGHVTVQSLYRYVLPRVQDAARRANRDQAPQLWPADLSASSDLVLR